MQMMKEKMDMMMNTMRGQVSTNLDKLVQRMDSPFIAQVTSFPLLAKFQMPQVEAYNGSQDPLDHLESFKTLIHLQGVSNKIMYTPLHSRDQQGWSSANWHPILSLPSRNWADTSSLTLSGNRGTSGPQQACWTLSNRKMKTWAHTWLISIRRPFWLTKPTKNFWSPRSPTSFN